MRVVAAMVTMVLAIVVLAGAAIWSLSTIVDGAVDSARQAEHETVPLLQAANDTNEVARLLARSTLDPVGGTQARRELPAKVASVNGQLRAIRPDAPKARALLASATRQWQTAMAALPAALEPTSAPFNANTLAVQAGLQKAAESFRAAYDLSLADLRDKLGARVEQRRQAALVMLVATLASLVVAVLAAWRLTRSLVNPIKNLRAGAVLLAANELDEPLATEGPRELADLGQAFNEMARELHSREADLVFQALHDPLTGLGNRLLLNDRLDTALARLRRRSDAVVALLLLDLDNFKQVNDTMGHPEGDKTLRDVAQRISRCLRDGDTLARLGGDEFAVVVEDVDGAATAIAERIQTALKEPYHADGQKFQMSASIGIATATTGSESTPQLLRDADLAMYEAKRTGGGATCAYDETFHTQARHRLLLENELRRALDDGELEVHYQPVMDLSDDTVSGVEALVRWNHPRRGLLEPREFLPLAEETGLIVELGWQVLQRATRDARRWIDEGGLEQFQLAVNFASLQIESADFVDRVMRALKEVGLAPHQLVLEITETAMLRSVDDTHAKLEELRRLGVRVALDDFGTGYTSLQYLRDYPVDVLKIDRAFVAGLDQREDLRALVRTIVTLADAFGLTTIAEGVEEPAEADALRALHCQLAQGYLFSRPVPAARIETLLHQQRRPVVASHA